MSILNDLYNGNVLNEGSDMSALPDIQMKELQKNIRKGAENSGEWANALALVHKSYKVANIQRPTPNMNAAWKQYESNIQYAVQQLSKYHGMDSDWRMSSSSFRETNEYTIQTIKGEGLIEEYTIEAFNMKEVIGIIKETIDQNLSIEIKEEDGETELGFTSYGSIKSPYRMLINLVK